MISVLLRLHLCDLVATLHGPVPVCSPVVNNYFSRGCLHSCGLTVLSWLSSRQALASIHFSAVWTSNQNQHMCFCSLSNFNYITSFKFRQLAIPDVYCLAVIYASHFVWVSTYQCKWCHMSSSRGILSACSVCKAALPEQHSPVDLIIHLAVLLETWENTSIYRLKGNGCISI